MNPPSSLLDRLQQLTIRYCIGFLFLYIGVEIIELTYVFGRAVFITGDHAGRLLISRAEMNGIVPVFFSILIAFELVETLRVYLREHAVRIQLILLVGLTAMTRHLLAADVFHGEPWLNFSLAALIVALALAYFLVDRPVKSHAP